MKHRRGHAAPRPHIDRSRQSADCARIAAGYALEGFGRAVPGGLVFMSGATLAAVAVATVIAFVPIPRSLCVLVRCDAVVGTSVRGHVVPQVGVQPLIGVLQCELRRAGVLDCRVNGGAASLGEVFCSGGCDTVSFAMLLPAGGEWTASAGAEWKATVVLPRRSAVAIVRSALRKGGC